MRSEDYAFYTIVNDGIMCDARGGPATDGSYLKITLPDSDTSTPTGGFTPVGDPTFSWLQSASDYCQAGRCALCPCGRRSDSTSAVALSACACVSAHAARRGECTASIRTRRASPIVRRYDTTSWMYTNYPCTEVRTRLMKDGRRAFSHVTPARPSHMHTRLRRAGGHSPSRTLVM